MATLALAREFLAEYSKLDHAIQKRVQDLAEKCRLLSLAELNRSKGIHLETHKGGQKDPRARTIRLGDNHRGIVLVPEGSEQIVLVDVLPHQEADRWMTSNEFKVNTATGALEVVNAGAIAETAAAIVADDQAPTPEATLLFAHRRDKDFTQLGIAHDLIPALRVFTDDDQLEGLVTVLPQGQAEALILLTGEDTVESIYTQVAGSLVPDEIDPDDLVAAIATPASQAQFHIVTDEEELADMLARPLTQWRTYLHPTQHDTAYRPTYNGPARVTGGAGTGKTVVAMHRAKALADQTEGRTANPILFTTYTRNLAQSIERDLQLLGGADLLEAVQVLNVDRLAHQVVRSTEGSAPRIISTRDLERLWDTKAMEIGYDEPAGLLIQEWEQVVLAQDIQSRDEYFRASRSGRGVRLDRKQRARVWKVIEAATREMESRNVRTHLQIAAKAAGYLAQEPVKPYRHVIVDEAQDLHETQWRLLRAAVAEGLNDMFIVGDSHQRIYGRRSSLSKVGINIRGRSRKLRINYRTTRQILRWSLAVLGEGDFDDLDDGTDTQETAGYHSFLEGATPTCAGFDSRATMMGDLTDQVKRWVDAGVDESAIAVAARTSRPLASVSQALRAKGVLAFELGPDLRTADGVALGTMHRMKGLEYRCIAIIDASADRLPDPQWLTPASEDPVQHDVELRQERSLLYVAATRAREDLWVGWSGDPSPFLQGVS